MNPIMILKGLSNKHILDLGTKSKLNDGIGIGIVVYQDEAYSLIIEADDNIDDILNVEIMINNEMIESKLRFSSIESKTLCEIILYNKQIFSLTYGITEIIIKIEYNNGTEDYYFSDPIIIAVRKSNMDRLESISAMLDDIYIKNHTILFRNKIQNLDLNINILKKNSNKYDEEIDLLKSIIQILVKNYPYFLANPKQKTVLDFRVDYSEKLQSFRKENLQYIATHPEELKQVHGSTGININRKFMVPEKTLVSTNKFSYDIVENRAIISFIKNLIEKVNERCEIITLTIISSRNIVNTSENLKENYILSTRIFQQYYSITFNKFIEEYKKILKQLENVHMQYSVVLPCASSIMRFLPSPTPIFMEIYHYRNVYRAMHRWFGTSDIKFPIKNVLLHFSNADKIYEYYCLLHLCDVLVSLGFIEIQEKRSCYKYNVRHPKFEHSEIDNTYHFKKNNTEITLYYQPVIYSYYSSTNNDITLFRTDANYYIPDFIIKKTLAKESTYAILDSKWRNRSSLNNKEFEGGFQDSVYKYLYSVVDSKNLKSIDFMWILQGKNDIETVPTLFNRNGAISRKQNITFKNHSGIVRLTPESGTQELKKIIKSFIE